jgi:Phage integrase, N-terminal SAM-like domain
MSLTCYKPVIHAQIFAGRHNLTELFPFFQQAEAIIGPGLQKTTLDTSVFWYNITAETACYRNRIFSNFSFAIPREDEHYIPMTQTAAHTNPHTLVSSLEDFTRSLTGAKSTLTIQAYRSDLQHFFTWLTETDYTVTSVERISRNHIEDYFAHLADSSKSYKDGFSRFTSVPASLRIMLV